MESRASGDRPRAKISLLTELFNSFFARTDTFFYSGGSSGRSAAPLDSDYASGRRFEIGRQIYAAKPSREVRQRSSPDPGNPVPFPNEQARSDRRDGGVMRDGGCASRNRPEGPFPLCVPQTERHHFLAVSYCYEEIRLAWGSC
ncbi:hypothetical protein JTE90_001964 [Oedothorax gibbosus]|uniref:Uncharacterized protein n=1 Tax=Oedothorax gibbosus TaxID=931172 RepID=A0AAV6VV25_9ARAC|nr:hypothetical protein JTE90_001964 [Oedothorax gibbosus]